VAEGLARTEELEEVEGSVARIVADAVRFAEGSPEPAAAAARGHMFATVP
jgi:TPP-dependent pyruvate/acetoin dehydrogenase alpha subunit